MVTIGIGNILAQGVNRGDQSDKVRLAPGFSERPASKVLVQVADSLSFRKWARKQVSFLKIAAVGEKLFSVSGLNKKTLQKMLTAPDIKFIDRADRAPKEEVVLGNFDKSVNSITSVHASLPFVTGNGLTVSIKEKPFDIQDIDLKGRIVLNEMFDEPSTLHATFVATIAVGGGNTSPFARGAAWGSTVTTSDFSQLLPDEGSGLTASGVTVQNHSYGVGVENYYGIESSEYDQVCLDFPKILHVFSSGNEGDKASTEGAYAGISGFANLTGQFKVSKNTLSVGSSDRYGDVVAKSSRGPAHDGRVKPELIAFGDAGSSEAAALVSGTALLVQESYKNTFGDLPDAALVKAILLNSADDTGRPQVDFETGFGNADALGAVQTVLGENLFSGDVTQDEEMIFTVDIPSGTDVLKVTLVWNDPPAEPFSSIALINDLDLTVRNVTSSETWDPWVLDSSSTLAALQQLATRGKDRLNNVEQVTVDFPASGTYEIRVTGYSIQNGSQSFFIAYELTSGFEWRFPLEKDALHSNMINTIRWQWHTFPATGLLEYRFTSANDWHPVDSIDLDQSNYDWLAPDTAALVQLRITAGTGIFESPVFTLSDPDRLKVGYNCADEVMLLWSKSPSVQGYRLYQLGEKYLEPLLTTADTFAVLQKTTLQSDYFTVVPLFENQEGARELTIDYHLQGTGCYFITFLAQEYVVTDEAAFQVTLGTVFNLVSATLERKTGEAFEPVVTIAPVVNKLFYLYDTSPRPGIGKYRIKLITGNGLTVFSDEEEIVFVPQNELYVYPNPLIAGEFVNVITSDDASAVIQVIDMYGKLVGEETDFGEIKSIDTSQLAGGTYILRVFREDGGTLTRRLVIIR